jgi:hypothetical protein
MKVFVAGASGALGSCRVVCHVCRWVRLVVPPHPTVRTRRCRSRTRWQALRVYGLRRAAYRVRYSGQPPSLSTPS